MTRALFLSTIYPRAYDRTRGIYCHHLCKELAADHAVRVISPRTWLEAARRPAANSPDLDVGLTEYPTYFHTPGVLHSKSAEPLWWSIRRTVRRAVAEFRPDCVLSYWAHPDGEAAVRAGQLAGAPVGVIVGGSDVLILPNDPKRRRVIVHALKRADAVFTVNRDLRDHTVKLGIDPAKVHVVYQGVDAKFTPGDRHAARQRLGLPDGNLLVWVGRMDPVKGLEVLAAACAKLHSERVEFTLALVGDGPSRAGVEADVRRLGLADRVRFAGMVRHDQLPDWYRAADLSVLSSHSEGIPNVLRESLACGTPYVATNVGGIAELSDDPAVRLVPPTDPAALADGIRAALVERRRLLPTTTVGTWKEYTREVLSILLPASVAGLCGAGAGR